MVHREPLVYQTLLFFDRVINGYAFSIELRGERWVIERVVGNALTPFECGINEVFLDEKNAMEHIAGSTHYSPVEHNIGHQIGFIVRCDIQYSINVLVYR